MKTISIKVGDEMNEWLKKMAERENKNVSEMIITFLERIKLYIEIDNEFDKRKRGK